MASIKKSLIWLQALALAGSLTACRKANSDEGDTEGAVKADSFLNLSGTIKGQSSATGEMNGWLLVIMESLGSTARTAKIGPTGSFSFTRVRANAAQTLCILDQQFKFSGCLSFPGAKDGSLRSHFFPQKEQLPALVHRGPFLTFSSTEGISYSTEFASDGDNDLIPDGLESANLSLAATDTKKSQNTTDTDNDGLYNDLDPDIDGDGIPNVFDDDDDADGILDIFDADADGNGLPDSQELTGDLHFPLTAESLCIQSVYDVRENAGALSLKSTLGFFLKLKSGAVVSSIKILGSDSALLKDSQAIAVDAASGAESLTNWDLNLLDDGLSADGSASDGVYGRQVVLADKKSPRVKQSLFFETELQNSSGQLLTEAYPYTFPNITINPIKGSWDASTKKLSLVGTAFEGIDQALYHWTIQVYGKDGQKVYGSPPFPATRSVADIPLDSFSEADQSYTAKILIQSLDRIPGYPNILIRSPSVNLN